MRDRASVLAVQILEERQAHIADREALAWHMLSLPGSLHRGEEDHSRLCQCTALHLYRKAAMDRPELRMSREQLAGILRHLEKAEERI